MKRIQALLDTLAYWYSWFASTIITLVFNSNLRLQLRQWELYKNAVVNEDRTMEMGVKLKLVTTTFQGSNQIRTLQWSILNSLRFVVPEKERLRLYVRSAKAPTAPIDRYESLLTNTNKTAHLQTENVASFYRKQVEEGNLIDYEVYLTLTQKPAKRLRRRSYDAFTLEEQYVELSKTMAALVETLQANFSAEVMTQQELFALAYKYFNPFAEAVPAYEPIDRYTPPHLIRRYPNFGELTLRDQLAQTVITPSVHPMQIGDGYCSVLSLTSAPRSSTSPTKAAAMLQHQTDFWLVVDYQHLDYQKARDKIQSRRKRFDSFVKAQRSQGVSEDAEKEYASEEASEARVHMEKTGAHPYRVGMSLLLFDKDRAKLLRGIESSRRSIVNAFGIKPRNPFFTQTFQYLSLSPGSGYSNRTAYDMFDSNAADYFPYNAPWRGSRKPAVLLQSNWDTITSFDPFDADLANGNAIFFGGTGKGKSVLVQKLLRETLKEDLEVFIVDQKQDYKTCVEFYGGVTYVVSLEGGFMRNPFDLEKGELEPSSDKLSRLKLDIQALAESNGNRLTDLQVAILEESLKQVYQRNLQEKVAENGDIVRSLTTPVVSDLVEQLRRLNSVNRRDLTDLDRAAATELASKLERWTGDTPQGRFIDRQTIERPVANLTYYDISGMKSYEELSVVGSLMVFADIWRRLKQNSEKRKLVIFEEVWGMFDIPAAAQYLTDIPKLIRSFNGVFWAVTQEPKDLRHPKAQSILANTSVRWSLQVTDSDQIDILKNMLGLSDETLHIIENLTPRKEAFLWLNKDTGNEGDVVRIELTPEEYWLSTSHPAEANLRRETLLHYRGDIEKAVSYLASTYPQGTKHLELVSLKEAA
jgi:conjugal transfer ATP-binding protein TraC